MREERIHTLRKLAPLYGVQMSYRDVFGRRHVASPDAIGLILDALGAKATGDPSKSLLERRAELASRVLEPVTASWEGTPCLVSMRLPDRSVPANIECRLLTEAGVERIRSIDPRDVPASREIDGVGARRLTLHVSSSLPLGYHRFSVSFSGRVWQTMIICAPRRAYDALSGKAKAWGLFAPLYALHSRRWGSGDFTDLGRLMAWVSELGGRFTATLPLFPLFLDEPLEPSPYLPVSRLFWNEFYVDPSKLPEFEQCPKARAVLGSGEWSGGKSRLIDYRGLMSGKRRVLESLAATHYSRSDGGSEGLRSFLRERPEVEDYARFRAEVEARREPWSQWPGDDAAPRSQTEEALHYHVYAQFAAHNQMQSLTVGDDGLYLDFPLGVHPHGYDAWKYRDLFCRGVTAGAPPDDFFRNGQNWGFPPLLPEKIRESRYGHFIATIRHIFSHADFVRLDHVMGLHRLFWIPEGVNATDGAYVQYPAEELYAIICLESVRHETTVIGEDLGTVPERTRNAMRRHGLYRSSVFNFHLRDDPGRPISPIPEFSFAALNTHDMPTFAGWWQGLDIGDRVDMGLLTAREGQDVGKEREKLKKHLSAFLRERGFLKGESGKQASILRACLAYLADSPCRALSITLEDLWGEPQPQNVPGTTSQERPNWQRRMQFPVDEALSKPGVVRAMRRLAASRRGL